MSFKCDQCELKSNQCCIRELLKRIQQLEQMFGSVQNLPANVQQLNKQLKTDITDLNKRISNLPRGELRF